MPTSKEPPFFITISRLGGQYAQTLSTTRLDCPKDAAWEALLAVRSGLPADCGASLTDACGYNVRP